MQSFKRTVIFLFHEKGRKATIGQHEAYNCVCVEYKKKTTDKVSQNIIKY